MTPDPEQLAGFFDRMYEGAGRDARAVPWAHLAPNPELLSWLDGAASAPGAALVVGCGLGDDAEELARRGWQVTAFDAAPTAIAWTVERFPDSSVDYRVADIFAMPTEWRQAFDLVVDVRTIQSLPPHLRDEVVTALTHPVAPGGTLIAVANGRPEGSEVSGPPWPLTRRELEAVAATGLELVRLDSRGGMYLAEYRRPG